MKQRTPISIGREYGFLTVLCEAPKSSHGHLMYCVRCRCGKEFSAQKSNILKGTSKCLDCSRRIDPPKRRIPVIGQTINGWHVISEAGKNKVGAPLFHCRCVNCGSEVIKTRTSLYGGKDTACRNCPPEYHFSVKGATATGQLPDGSVFQIDASDIPFVAQRYWHKSASGYIISNSERQHNIRLHRYLLELTDDEFTVDHINRDKLDCRRDNLRIVTAQQNSMNKSIQKNNKSGFVGVYYVSRKKKYCVKIGLNNRNIYLGYTFDPVEGAQMYNVASDLLFGEFAGHKNDVPPPEAELVKKIELKCQPYIMEAVEATQPMSGHFLSA